MILVAENIHDKIQAGLRAMLNMKRSANRRPQPAIFDSEKNKIQTLERLCACRMTIIWKPARA